MAAQKPVAKKGARHKSALKRARQTIKRNALNRSRRSVVRAQTKAVDTAVATSDVAVATKALRTAESTLARAAARNTLHWKTAARKTSRLAKSVKLIAQKKTGK